MFTDNVLYVTRVTFDEDFCVRLREKCKNFYVKYILPILCVKPSLKNSDVAVCWCRRPPSYSSVIRCCDEDCHIKIYHRVCVGVKKLPRRWICSECTNS